MRLSAHFDLAEMTFTQVRGVDNTPSLGEAGNLKFLCENLLEPVRAHFGPLIITSGFRSVEVNIAVGGSPLSMHQRGCAADFVPRRGVPLTDIIEWVMASELPWDQVILERPGQKLGTGWVHLGTRPAGLNCRKQALMSLELGKFEPFNSEDPRVTR